MSRQAATPGCYIVGSMKNNNEKQANGGEAKAKPEMIKLGLDLHARQVTECRQLDGSTPKLAQKWDPWKLLGQIESWVQAGIRVYSCYEAGACGYWYHRELTRVGAVNFVVVPRPLEDQRTRHHISTVLLTKSRNDLSTSRAMSILPVTLTAAKSLLIFQDNYGIDPV